MTGKYKNFLIEVTGAVAVVTINRPEVRNALNLECWKELKEITEELRVDDAVRAVIFTGAGGKAFVSGADIGMLKERTAINILYSTSTSVLNDIEWLPKVTIAAIDGVALGGGNELAMACDIRIATKKSKFGQPEIHLGVIPSAGGTQRLTRYVGIGKAKELILTGNFISAEEAYDLGLVNQVVEDAEELMKSCMKMASGIAAKSPVAVSLAKSSINFGAENSIQAGLRYEQLSQSFAFTTDDKEEGVSAFLEKRKAEFHGR